jgi:hypothetical protein
MSGSKFESSISTTDLKMLDAGNRVFTTQKNPENNE